MEVETKCRLLKECVVALLNKYCAGKTEFIKEHYADLLSDIEEEMKAHRKDQHIDSQSEANPSQKTALSKQNSLTVIPKHTLQGEKLYTRLHEKDSHLAEIMHTLYPSIKDFNVQMDLFNNADQWSDWTDSHAEALQLSLEEYFGKIPKLPVELSLMQDDVLFDRLRDLCRLFSYQYSSEKHRVPTPESKRVRALLAKMLSRTAPNHKKPENYAQELEKYEELIFKTLGYVHALFLHEEGLLHEDEDGSNICGLEIGERMGGFTLKEGEAPLEGRVHRYEVLWGTHPSLTLFKYANGSKSAWCSKHDIGKFASDTESPYLVQTFSETLALTPQDTYHGYCYSGFPNGEGRLVMGDGREYSGLWKEGRMVEREDSEEKDEVDGNNGGCLCDQ